ncbi:addiction module toxin RelE [Candidatus Kaiserbacteria bacterium RIFCSPHIGHO2_02_FULL_59_21]|uniref:Addiction module toxin RelE n=1 Tax=Candidatus Kaiserbacteria bacterium RIFCSPHIGHO2_02_FULL_59_21 TaxID=1798500 RepID=A0A1F6E0I7_9BACT|nr:MAG: addiction module toxin RelE [Candidatus Kaiserbacteria bacterium RIFCSPHIGHO2_01_FULL_58_22]OGG67214.1 MAG: addiction module toxin RelE [Candidatus Kaiserbacteria bacterium RIFCSPHIGHO2_02_FULL_59_21]OGG79726.1 MAG: addiction module toxin RelE [Candidatus Kaiserbacteria bacterium RIFCSPLOWO2_01_FULL_59_34]OGG86369.1 MAG: addiction module toxin RelE [Candidatus Kaiserbacteria bacterium RIFCSPLOWO2_02_FULL_59_19]
MLVLNLENRARHFLNKLPPKQFGQVDRKITELQEIPFPHDTKRIKGMDWYRVDVGEYRIIFNVRDGVLNVPLIGKRNGDEVYKQLKRLMR